MTAELVIDQQAFENSVMAEFQKVKIPCQAAMAEAFRGVVNANLGDEGVTDKPQWDALQNSRYAKRVNRTEATLRLTASESAKVGGIPELLYNSTGMEVANPDFASVWNSCEYADYHQFGGKVPARPFFPIANGEVTETTKDLCVAACEKELIARLN